jgi:predicted Kef-type K+ transport protein
MDPLWITLAFLLGFGMRQVGLPPLVGYLAAGFLLHGLGVEGSTVLEEASDLGVTLLLFTIGLKLRLRTLLRPEVWGGGGLHMAITVLLFGGGLYGLSSAGVPVLRQLDLPLCFLVAFALSFSSTVFAVKVLEERGEAGSLHGRVSIGILIVQDLIAVAFLTVAAGKAPSAWALGLPVYLFLVRPVLTRVMERCGHGELLILFGLFMALVAGAGSFAAVGVKADLGALAIGVLVAGHPKAEELAKALLGFKDLFLVGFFLTIGLGGLPSPQTLGISALLVAAVAFKVALFFGLLTRFRLRARTALLASFSLANYSEFGLIVGAIAVRSGWLGSEWLVIVAVALAISFVVAAPLNALAHSLYDRWDAPLRRLETRQRHPEDRPIDVGGAEIAVFGMGRVGTGTYDTLRARHGDVVVGVDFDGRAVGRHREQGRNVILGDATDSDFWERVKAERERIRMVVLAMPTHAANVAAARRLAAGGYEGIVAAVAQFDDQVEELRHLGVDLAFNLYGEAAAGFARDVTRRLEA